jgi:hypothetical protein
MKRHFVVYASKNRRRPIKYSGDDLHKLWVSMSDSDQFAAEYAMGFINSDGYIIENLSDDDLESYARRGCNQINEGNAEPEYAEEEWYEDEADFDTVFNYLKAKRDDSVAGSASIDEEIL